MVGFAIFSALAFIGALTVVTTRSPYKALAGLFINFTSIGALFLIAHSPFLGFVQIAVYAGGVIILFLFVIMLISPKKIVDDFDGSFRGFLYIFFSLLFLGGILLAVIKALKFYGEIQPYPVETQALGEVLLKNYTVPFEVVSVLLTVAIVAAFYIARREA